MADEVKETALEKVREGGGRFAQQEERNGMKEGRGDAGR